MSFPSDAPADIAAQIVPEVRPTAPWRVTSVEPLPGYRLRVRFVDGVEGFVSMAKRVNARDAGVFAALSDPDIFAKAGVILGAVTWPGNMDLAPDAMHDEIEAHGEWVLE